MMLPCDVGFSSFSSSFSSFFPLPNLFFEALPAVAEFYFLIISSELVLPVKEADANLFFFGVVIRFSFELVLSLSVA